MIATVPGDIGLPDTADRVIDDALGATGRTRDAANDRRRPIPNTPTGAVRRGSRAWDGPARLRFDLGRLHRFAAASAWNRRSINARTKHVLRYLGCGCAPEQPAPRPALAGPPGRAADAKS
jgi:hypothetical protein